MRTAKQVKVINSQLDILLELKEQLLSVLAYINNVMQKGTSWIEETEHASFTEINHFLANEITECFQRCLNLANDNIELSQLSCARNNNANEGSMSVGCSTSMSCAPTTCFTENQKLTEKISEVEKQIAKQSKTLKAMKQIFAEQVKETAETIEKLKEEVDRKGDLKCKEIMTELQAASYFMSGLQTQNELLTNQVNNTIEKHNEMEEKFNRLEKYNICKDDSANTVKFDEINRRVSENRDDIKEIKNQNESLLTTLKDVEKRLNGVLQVVDPLKTSFESYAEKEDWNMKIRNISSQVKEMQQRINSIECTNLAIGFEACPEEIDYCCDEDEILTCFTHMIQQYGNNFDTNAGIYTVPIDGIYLCALFIEIDSFVKNEMRFDLCLKLSNDEESEEPDEDNEVIIAKCHTKYRSQTVCDVTIREMKSEDQLYIKYMSQGQDIKFNTNSHFTCVLLNPC